MKTFTVFTYYWPADSERPVDVCRVYGFPLKERTKHNEIAFKIEAESLEKAKREAEKLRKKLESKDFKTASDKMYW